jgi:hypothetical protein
VDVTRESLVLCSALPASPFFASTPHGDRVRSFTLTTAGCEIVDALLTARRNRLEELWSDWSEDTRAEVAIVLHRLAKDLVPGRWSA